MAVLMLTAFAVGRYSQPDSVKESKTVTAQEKVQVEKAADREEDKSRELERQIIVTEQIKPDGTVLKRTRTIAVAREHEQSKQVNTETLKTDSSLISQEVRETRKASRSLSLGVMAGRNNLRLAEAPRLGVYVLRPFLGPLDLGLWLTNEWSGGVSLGLTF